MKHFIGGWALGFVVVFFYSLERCKKNGLEGIILGLVFGLPFAFLAWGLLP